MTAASLRLALVSFPARESPEALPLGAASVAAAIRAHPALAGLVTAMIAGRPGEGAEGLAARVAASEAGAAGLSVYSWNRDLLADVARRVRAASPGVVLFAGGPEATADPEGLIEEAGLDFAVAGEGETAATDALRAIIGLGEAPPADGLGDALRDIAGVVLPPSGSGPRRAYGRAPPEDPATLPSPWLLGTISPRDWGGDVAWELSRGCPFRCAYCYESKGASGSRPFGMDRIEAELALFVREGVRYIFVLDPTFDADAGRARALLDLFRAAAPGMRWKFEVRAELLDTSLVRRFAALDCSLQIGLQSARRETLAAVGRPGFDRSEFARKVAGLSAAGLSFGLDLIYGLPGDSLADFEEGVDYALGLGPNHLDVFPLALLPGTELAERAVELGIEADPRPPYLVRSTRELDRAALASAAELAAACDRFYTAGRAVGWLDAARKPLRAAPSALLREFSSWLAARGGPGADDGLSIEAEQLDFLGDAYRRAGLGALLPALRDLVRLHGAWGRALAEGEESVLDLSYDPEEILGAAPAGLAAFGRAARRAGASWRVVPDEAEGALIRPADRSPARGPARGKPIARGESRRAGRRFARK